MKLAKKAFIISLTMLALIFTVSAQTLRSEKDPRNTAPTVGTGGPVGGPTGLFTVYDGQTLRRGEFTFSIAYSNYDRDPGDVDIVEVPLSFQIGLSDNLELFFNTDGYRGVKVNSPGNLSSFFLPNATFGNRAALVLGPGGTTANLGVFRPAGNQFFAQFPFVGNRVGNFGFNCDALGGTDRVQCLQQFQNTFGSPFGALNLGTPQTGGSGADLFPGIGSVFGGILPGVVLQTVVLGPAFTGIGAGTTAPTVFALAPSYLPDAPFIGRTYGESAFSTYTVGAKIRFTGPNNPIGLGVIPFYRFYGDSADSQGGFNQLQRGASPGGGGANFFNNRGDIGLIGFADARLRKWVNVSANVGYIYNSSVKSEAFGGNEVTLLDRGDELIAAIGVDFPVNKYFQPILEIRSLQYVGGRTPNAFENDPIDGLAGIRIFPKRYFGFSFAYRYHANQQDADSFDNSGGANNVRVLGNNANANLATTFTGVPPGFRTSSDPHGFITQFFIGRRNLRQAEILNQPAVINSVDVSDSTVKLGCPAGQVPVEGETCPDDQTVSLTTNASDPENDVLTYNYTVSGGRIVGQGANVSWDLSGVQPGTYTVTVGVDDGCGVCSPTVTETITVENCNCTEPINCDCPSISIEAPNPVAPGENMSFTVNVRGGSQPDLTYDWSVDRGEIISGQGTPTIIVSTVGLSDTTVQATVNFGGYTAGCDCEDSAQEAGIVSGERQAELIDEFDNIPNNDIRTRLDSFFIRLQGEPNSTGYIINYGSARQVAARERLIRDHIRLRGFDASRIVLVNGGVESGIRTKLWLVPQGVDPSDLNE